MASTVAASDESQQLCGCGCGGPVSKGARYRRGHYNRSRFAGQREGHRICPACETEKPVEEFPLDASRPTGRHTYCAPCKARKMREANARWRRKNPEAARRSNRRRLLRKKYGISLEEYEALLEAQGGGCGICGAPDPLLDPEAPKVAFAVDHCHETGKVRGVLCAPCNLGLGHFRDDPSRLRAAVAYLD